MPLKLANNVTTPPQIDFGCDTKIMEQICHFYNFNESRKPYVIINLAAIGQ